MNKNGIHKVISSLLFLSYLNLIALTVFHFHSINYNDKAAVDNSQHSTSKVLDPFSDGNSNCSVTQFSSSSYIDEKVFCSTKSFVYSNRNYSIFSLSSRPLQIILSSNSLRAPPFAS